MAFCLALLLLPVLALGSDALAAAVLKSTPARASEAYVTLVYGEEFVLAARVLGQSLRDSGTTSLGCCIVFLDADVLVMRNLDSIFRCPGFCAALRHSERFNTGVMSLVPSAEMYADLMAKVASMPSYTGGDQGFLNSYFSGFAHAPLFEPDTPYTPDQYKYMRLPTTYNADIGLFVVGSNKWMIPRSSLYIIHYTLGPFKPWVWWSGWLVAENPAWQAVRARLPPDSSGLRAGRSSRQLFAERWMLLAPWAVAAAAAYLFWASFAPWALSALLPAKRGLAAGGGGAPVASAVSASGARGGSGSSVGADVVLRMAGGGAGGGAGDIFPRHFMAGTIAAGYGCVLAATVVTILIVPPEVDPLYGWTLSYEWGFMLLALLYGSFLRACFKAGRRAGHHPAIQPPKASAHQPHSLLPRAETASSAAFLVASLLLAPWLGRLLGIRSFAGTIVATVFIGLGVIVVATIQFAFLPAQWFVAGRMSAAGSASRAA
ncbi:putative glucuronosyltransferase [Tetrabaena socialis]|uniref:Putative glucuronosyltransferase n=1 Tax=Tetrabaena socialis TaxID=47790 RepID=A0A2J7ZM10_9CHLO|nr:putative glucuronosyltransferase [Tetrabaena socialis]|eukprot:PNH01302.1 putative glucuronosyltransferase [Tetrabaena socialis]